MANLRDAFETEFAVMHKIGRKAAAKGIGERVKRISALGRCARIN